MTSELLACRKELKANKERIERLLLEPGKSPAMKMVEVWLILNGSVEVEHGGQDAAALKLMGLCGLSRSTTMKALKGMRAQGRIAALERGYRYQEGE